MFGSFIRQLQRKRTIRRLILNKIHFSSVDADIVVETLNKCKHMPFTACYHYIITDICNAAQVDELIQQYIIVNEHDYGNINFSDKMQSLICSVYPNRINDILNPNEATTIYMILRMIKRLTYDRIFFIAGHAARKHTIVRLLEFPIPVNELRSILLSRLYGGLNDTELDELILINKLAY